MNAVRRRASKFDDASAAVGRSDFAALLADVKGRIEAAQTRALPARLQSALPTVQEIEAELGRGEDEG